MRSVLSLNACFGVKEVNKKIIGLITTIAIISIIIGSTAVTAKEDNGKPMWERLFSVFVTNTNPIPVSVDSLTDVSIKVGTYYQVVFNATTLAPNTKTERLYFNVDGYKTIHIWCIVGPTGSPKIDVDFSYPDTVTHIPVGIYTAETFETISVIAPEISFQFTNFNDYDESAFAIVIFYAQAI
jgi:hypothetical protein